MVGNDHRAATELICLMIILNRLLPVPRLPKLPTEAAGAAARCQHTAEVHAVLLLVQKHLPCKD